jgi:hypothetical protein
LSPPQVARARVTMGVAREWERTYMEYAERCDDAAAGGAQRHPSHQLLLPPSTQGQQPDDTDPFGPSEPCDGPGGGAATGDGHTGSGSGRRRRMLWSSNTSDARSISSSGVAQGGAASDDDDDDDDEAGAQQDYYDILPDDDDYDENNSAQGYAAVVDYFV